MAAKPETSSTTFQTTVGSKRQITISAEACRQLSLQPGDKVTMWVRDGQLHLTPAASDFEVVMRQHFGPADFPGDTTQELRDSRGWTEYEAQKE